MRLYGFLRIIASLLTSLLLRLRVRGREHIPTEGACILAANHIHALDPFILAVLTKRQIRFMAKEEIMSMPIVGWIAKRAGVFPVKRGKVDVQAVRQALGVLNNGGVLGIFPEGTRSKTGEMQEAFTGAALLAARTGAPIVPVALHGRFRIGSLYKVNVGQPICIKTEVPGKPTAEERAIGTKALMHNIAELLEQCNDEGW